jgi:hypothetical protein
MTRRIRPAAPHRFQCSIDTRVEACAVAGFEIRAHDAAWAWEQHSERRAAQSLCLDDDDPASNVATLRVWLVPEDGKEFDDA